MSRKQRRLALNILRLKKKIQKELRLTAKALMENGFSPVVNKFTWSALSQHLRNRVFRVRYGGFDVPWDYLKYAYADFSLVDFKKYIHLCEESK